MKKTVIIYSLALAVLAIALKTFEYKFVLREITWEIYVLGIALLFTVLGAWLGNHLLQNKSRQTEFARNEKAIAYLGLTSRELQVLEKIGIGASNQQAAEQLFISINTVKTHLKNCYDKLDASSRTQAIDKAKSLNIIE